MLRVASIGECMIEVAAAPPSANEPPRLGFGGDTLNTAVYLARALGAHAGRVDYVTALGEDPISAEMIAAWAAEGVHTDLVFRLPGALPGLYVIRTGAGGERTFYYWRRDAAARRMLDDGRDRVIADALRGHDLVYLSGVTLAILEGAARARLIALLGELRSAGARVAFDSNYRPSLWRGAAEARAAYAAIGACASIALPSLDDAVGVFGETSVEGVADRWQGWGALEVVVKNGPHPCLVAHDGQREWVATATVTTPVDTTAAGDSFNGAYLAARLLGETPAAAAAHGHALARRVIQHPGAVVPR